MDKKPPLDFQELVAESIQRGVEEKRWERPSGVPADFGFSVCFL